MSPIPMGSNREDLNHRMTRSFAPLVLRCHHLSAEEVGFEPTVPRCGTPVFETGPRQRPNTLRQGLSAILSPPRIPRIRLPIRLSHGWQPAGSPPVGNAIAPGRTPAVGDVREL